MYQYSKVHEKGSVSPPELQHISLANAQPCIHFVRRFTSQAFCVGRKLNWRLPTLLTDYENGHRAEIAIPWGKYWSHRKKRTIWVFFSPIWCVFRSQILLSGVGQSLTLQPLFKANPFVPRKSLPLSSVSVMHTGVLLVGRLMGTASPWRRRSRALTGIGR